MSNTQEQGDDFASRLFENTDHRPLSDRLNRSCYCKTLDSDRFKQQLAAALDKYDIAINIENLFAKTAVFVNQTQFDNMRGAIDAIEALVKLAEYQRRVTESAPFTVGFGQDLAGLFMGYDFHLDGDTAKLIEVNTNAGGAFINALLQKSQIDCCRPSALSLDQEFEGFIDKIIAIFTHEFRLFDADKPLTSIAIVDENPTGQGLYAEFILAKQVLEGRGIQAHIAAPEQLSIVDGKLCIGTQVVDMVYNRTTDFYLEHPHNTTLRRALEENLAAISPNPYHHALYANKRNLAMMADGQLLAELGLPEGYRSILSQVIPKTHLVTPENSDTLWRTRKGLFFKPTTSYGSKAVYRGDKLTKRVWGEIQQGDYIAQEWVSPGCRGVLVDGIAQDLKMDFRAYTYRGEILLLCARLYQGQTTNMRTSGGGFAPVTLV